MKDQNLDELIIGRIKPQIYAFTTNTIPNFLKVGDTYRPIAVRLEEWKQYFPNLKKEFEDYATINDDIFFRDISVHQYLENDLRKRRLTHSEIPKGVYYSKEFFKDTLPQEISNAINDIKKNYRNNTGKYKYYDANTRLPESYTYVSAGLWKPRPNQQETIDKFVKAVNQGRTNLLMYAVMRFGKSFTSLCCAKEKNYKLILVVSAKADVREEWKKTVESAENFNKDYIFLSSDELLRNEYIIKTTLQSGNGVVVFLTLQDLQGDNIKDKHKEIFGRPIDLLIVDETHYGARANQYGKVLRTINYDKDIKEKHADDDFVEFNEAEKQIKSLDVKVTLHLSGTPYRILMGSEFSKEDIIAFYQFSDIVNDKEEWDKKYLSDDERDIREWDNPYYGFPQMVRFAFIPSKSALSLLKGLKSQGTTYAFSALLKPKSIKKDTEKFQHKKFIHEKEVLELFEVIDGCKEDEGLLSFLDYDKIKEGKMCEHIVCVLPYCASCDALQQLIMDNRSKFKNLQNYTIINISGVDNPNEYRDIKSIKSKIKNCAVSGNKTLTLTVSRMLTGSTVEEWDTMIFLKDTASPQEYDQAIFRLQNQYIKEYIGDDGEKIRFNMKPQTLLVDFDPHRMFVMQEQKSQIYNANNDKSGNERLKDRISEELRISPIITLNKNRMVQVEATDILSVIGEYSSNRGVLDEAKDIAIDMNLLNVEKIKLEIEKQAELGSRQGLAVNAYDGEGSDMDVSGEDTPSDEKTSEDEQELNADSCSEIADKETSKEDIKKLENKFRTYYSRILFFAFLTKNMVSSLLNLIQCIEDEANSRIAKNLEIEKNVIILMQKHMNIFILRQLDYKIQNINTLAHDTTLDAMQKAAVAIKKFGRISESEITTPDNVSTDMINLIPDDCFISLRDGENNRILDIASKMGEFAIAIRKRCEEMKIPIDKVKNKILSIPTSNIAYEFTRKVYEILEFDVNSIAQKFNSYDLLKIKKKNDNGIEGNTLDYDKIKEVLSQNKSFSDVSLNDMLDNSMEVNKLNFNAVVGNPPYQEADGGAAASARPIYPYFVNASRVLSSSYSTLIMPSRWYTGGKNLNDFRKSMLDDIHIRELHDCLHPEEIFPNTNNRGGLCYLLWDMEYNNESVEKMYVVTHNGNEKPIMSNRSMKTRDLDVFVRNNNSIGIMDKVIPINEIETMEKYVSSRKPFGIESNIIKSENWHLTSEGMTYPVVCYGKRMKIGYIEKELIKQNIEAVERWKVFMPRANNIGTELGDDNLNTFLGKPGTICTEAYMAIGLNLNLNKKSAINLMNYFQTKFVRFMHSLAKASHDASRTTYRFVPVVDFNEAWTDKKLYAKFNLTGEEIALIEKSIKPMK